MAHWQVVGRLLHKWNRSVSRVKRRFKRSGTTLPPLVHPLPTWLCVALLRICWCGCCSWDTNKDGKLSPREFAKGLESALGVSSTEAWDMVDAMMPRMDIDGDGNLSYKEFLNTFRMSAVTSKLADKMRRA